MRRALPAILLAGWMAFTWTSEAAFGASALANGDFSTPGVPPDPFAAWTTLFGSPPTDGGGFAFFSESRTFAQTELEQAFGILPGSSLLSFEFLLDSEPDGSPGVPPDSFQATLYDAAINPFPTPSDPLLPAFYSIDATGQEFFDSSFVSVTTLVNGWRRVTLDISSLPAQDVILEFILNGGDDARQTTASLDNVVVTAVPEPSSCLLLLTGSLGWVATRHRRPSLRRAAEH